MTRPLSLRFLTAFAFPLALAVLCLWNYNARIQESATAEAEQADCLLFASKIQKKPLHKYAASDMERLNSCNALVVRDANAPGF